MLNQFRMIEVPTKGSLLPLTGCNISKQAGFTSIEDGLSQNKKISSRVSLKGLELKAVEETIKFTQHHEPLTRTQTSRIKDI